MKILRMIVAILLIITGILHIVIYFRAPGDPGSIGTLVFGIIYAITGLLLFTKNLYPLYLGVFLPLIGFTISLVKLGFPPLISLMALLLLIDVIVILSCGYILIIRKKA
jgi:hypothetical protein